MSLMGDIAEARDEAQRRAEKSTGKTGLDAKYDSSNLPHYASPTDVFVAKFYREARAEGSSPDEAERIARWRAGV